jgi:CheY-like chemotaxis protein
MERVICIDDDPICLLLADVVIQQSNVANEVLLANSAHAGLSLLKNIYSIDKHQLASQGSSTLIFLDLNMPVMNGWEFLDAFEKDYQHLTGLVKIVILTSSIDNADIIRSRQYNIVSDYISKPITADAMVKLKTGIVT